MLRLEGQRAVLFGVLLVEATQVGQLLDHLGVEEAPAGVVHLDVGLQRLRQVVLQLLHATVVLNAGAVCHQGLWAGHRGRERGQVQGKDQSGVFALVERHLCTCLLLHCEDEHICLYVEQKCRLI